MSQPPGAWSDPLVSPVITKASTTPKPSPASPAKKSATHGWGAGPGRPRAATGHASPEAVTPPPGAICAAGVMPAASQATLRGVCTQPVPLLKGSGACPPERPGRLRARQGLSSETAWGQGVGVGGDGSLESSERLSLPWGRGRGGRDRCRPVTTTDLARKLRCNGIDGECPPDQADNQRRSDDFGSEVRDEEEVGHPRHDRPQVCMPPWRSL